MEEKATAIATNNRNNKDADSTKNNDNALQRRKRGLLQLIRVALFMLRRRSGGKSKSVQVDVASKGMWKKLLGAMRPMHLQDNPSQPSLVAAATTSPPPGIELIQDVSIPQTSPQPPYSPSSSSSDDSMSRYASAQNLQELDKSQGCDEIEDAGGDEMIDARAEEFIAHFYEQMKLQRLNSINLYNEMMARGSR